MGLDQAWFVENYKQNEEIELIHSHRKVPALEQYMADKWDGEDLFNCEKLYIDMEIINELKEKCLNKELDHNATGFFWGQHYDEDYIDILAAIEKVEKLLNENKCIFYTSSW